MQIINCSWDKPKKVDFLDVTFNFDKNIYKLYQKPNNIHIYINKNLNHPPNILKQLPKSIAKHIPETSSSEDELKYLQNEVQELGNNNRRKCRRKIIWFNPPYSKNVKTNLGKVFLKLLKKHFPTSHILHKIFNKNTVKISYSCMENINYIISSHNKVILNPRTTSFGCNCRKKESCPLNGECLTSQLVYRATVTNAVNEDMNKYIGLADTTFKERHSNHKRDFKHQKYRNCTELAKYVSELKEFLCQ